MGPSTPRVLPWKQEVAKEDLPMTDRLESLSLKDSCQLTANDKRLVDSVEVHVCGNSSFFHAKEFHAKEG